MLLFFLLLLLSCSFLNFEAQTYELLKKNNSLTFLVNVTNNCYNNKLTPKRDKIHITRNKFRGVYSLNTNNSIHIHKENSKKEKEKLKECTIKKKFYCNDPINIIANIENTKRKSQIRKLSKTQKLESNKKLRDLKKDIKLQFFKKRIIYLTDEINKKTSDELISQLLYLDSLNNKDIKIFISSPGGSINDGLAILDIFNFIKSDVQTISLGLVASMGSVILAAGKKGKRKSLPNCRIMIHQPLGNAYGQPEDIEIQTKEIIYLKNLLYYYLSVFTNQTTDTIRKHSDRDYYMSAYEAKEYGIIDEVIQTKLPHPHFTMDKL